MSEEWVIFPLPEGIIRFTLLMCKMILEKLGGVERMVCSRVKDSVDWRIEFRASEFRRKLEKLPLYWVGSSTGRSLSPSLRVSLSRSVYGKNILLEIGKHYARQKGPRNARLIRSLAVSDIMASPRGRIDLVLFLASRTTFAV